jgi:signal transduction histidine kinase/HAMP domain-containing protein
MQDLFASEAPQKAVSGSDLSMSGTLPKIYHWINRKIQRKLVFILAVLLLITSTAFLAMVIALYKNQLVNEHARASMQVNRLLQVSLENAMLKRDIDGLREIVGHLGRQKGIAGVAILNPDFEVRFSSGAKHFGRALTSSLVKKALHRKTPQTRFISLDDGTPLLRSVNPVHNKPQCKECHGEIKQHPVNGLLVIDYVATGISQNALNSALMLGGIGAVVVFATGLGIWLALKGLVVVRLRRLRHTSRLFAGGKLEARASFEGHDEISELANSFDNMAERLGNSLQDLNASEKFLQSVIDAIPDGVRVIDDDYNIIKANLAYCQQSGSSMERVLSEKCYKSSHDRHEPCQVTLVDCPVAELRKTPSKKIKTRHQHFNEEKSELFVEVSAARVQLTINGKTSSFVIESIRDLAEQARISQEQRLSEIGLLATGVAHEIHNPLSSIMFALKAMQGDMENPVEHQKTDLDYLEIAEAEIQKCLEVTDQLLLLSLPPQDNNKLVDVDRVVRRTLSLLSYQIDADGVRMKLDLEEKLRMLAGENDLGMIVVNLIQNALHAMPEGGDMVVCCRRLEGKIKLQISDTGEGIAKRNLEKVFLPFWTKRADATGGRGLGLSICKAIVDRIGGTIEVVSRLGSGTTFTMMFPDADSERSEK